MEIVDGDKKKSLHGSRVVFRLDLERPDWSEGWNDFSKEAVIGQLVFGLPRLTAVRQRDL